MNASRGGVRPPQLHARIPLGKASDKEPYVQVARLERDGSKFESPIVVINTRMNGAELARTDPYTAIWGRSTGAFHIAWAWTESLRDPHCWPRRSATDVLAVAPPSRHRQLAGVHPWQTWSDLPSAE